MKRKGSPGFKARNSVFAPACQKSTSSLPEWRDKESKPPFSVTPIHPLIVYASARNVVLTYRFNTAYTKGCIFNYKRNKSSSGVEPTPKFE